MSALEEVSVVKVYGEDVSAADVFHSLMVNEKLDEMLRYVVDDIIIERKSQEMNVEVTDEELQKTADNIRRAPNLHKASETNQWLEENGLSVEDFEHRLRAPLLRSMLKKKVAESKVDSYFAENRFQFDKAVLSQIVVPSEEVAEELVTQITEEDADFEKLVERHSIDEASKTNNGSVGLTVRNVLSPSVQAAVFNASTGDVVGPVKTDMGFHIIRVDDLQLGELDDETSATVEDEIFQNWLDEEYEKASVETVLFASEADGADADE